MSILLLLHFATSCYMTGLCWLVQLVVYPQFARVAPDQFSAYHRFHMSRTSAVVVPVMVPEAVLAVLILFRDPGSVLAWVGVGLLAVVWINTFGQEVPRHEKLKAGYDAQHIKMLVRWNWPRTIAWTGRAVVGGLMLTA